MRAGQWERAVTRFIPCWCWASVASLAPCPITFAELHWPLGSRYHPFSTFKGQRILRPQTTLTVTLQNACRVRARALGTLGPSRFVANPAAKEMWLFLFLLEDLGFTPAHLSAEEMPRGTGHGTGPRDFPVAGDKRDWPRPASGTSWTGRKRPRAPTHRGTEPWAQRARGVSAALLVPTAGMASLGSRQSMRSWSGTFGHPRPSGVAARSRGPPGSLGPRLRVRSVRRGGLGTARGSDCGGCDEAWGLGPEAVEGS